MTILEVLNGCAEAIDKLDATAIDIAAQLIKKSKRVFVLGVGGSAANASHAVNDIRKIMDIEAYAPTDNVAELTAITNDISFDNIFVEWLHTSKICKDDLIIILSVNGGSKETSNCLCRAIDYATKRYKAKSISITGCPGGYAAANCDIPIMIQCNDEIKTPVVESLQSVILHAMVNS